MPEWQASNYSEAIPEVQKPFSIICVKGTDIFDKPPSTHRFDAPMIYTTTTVGSFKSATITIDADWKQRYDQGGLCLMVPIDGSQKWIKAGIEFLDGQPWISVVTKDRWADWSLRPVPDMGTTSATIHIETHDDGSLWVYAREENGKRLPVREVTWWGELTPETRIDIGPAAAKPSIEGEELVVYFSGFELNLS